MTGSLPSPDAMASLELLRATLPSSRAAIVLADPHRSHHPLVFCNRAFCDLTGYAGAEAIGRSPGFLQGRKSDPAALATLRDGIARLEEVQVELWNYRKDGSAFLNVMIVSPVFDRAGQPLFLLGHQLDATARREAEAVRRRTQRLDTVGGMAAGIAHEVNNLMTVALGGLEAVSSEPLTARQRERLERALWAIEAVGRQTRQMLSLARDRGGEATRIDLGQAVGAIDRVLAQLAGPAVAFEMALAPDPLPVRVDVGELELALINLVRNAADACAPGARITVSTRAGEGAAAELAVGDTGSGMSPALMDRVTEPFFTTKPRGLGTGLGLSMVRRFMDEAGGALAIASEPGCGTTIRMVFPAA